MLPYAASFGYRKAVRKLVMYNIDNINQRGEILSYIYFKYQEYMLKQISDEWAQTALHQATQSGHIDFARYLVEQGAEIDCQGRSYFFFCL